MEIETVLEGLTFLEAPRIDSKGNLYFSDIIIGGVYKRTPDGEVSHFLEERKVIGGMAINRDGRLVLSGRGGLILFDENSGEQEVLIDAVDGEPISSINDFQPDGEGGVYAGMIDAERQLAPEEGEAKPMILVRPDRSATIVSEPVEVTNGIGLSPGRDTVYQAETSEGVLAYDRAGDGTLSNRRLQIECPMVDGLAVDAEGGIWVASMGGGAVKRFLPDGTFDREIAIPQELVASVTFGGDDLRDMYVVTGGRFDLGQTKSGNVYRIRSDVAGLPTPLTEF